MKIDTSLISRLEELARLKLSAAERTKLTGDLSEILKMVEKLEELDTTGVEPLVYINDEVNVLRADKVDHQVSAEDAFKNAPNADGTYFKVPKVIH
jgi:aspartyl-tRNA(Asn)/glutamyl-tRNA(Gln) amidotransferase subunit C